MASSSDKDDKAERVKWEIWGKVDILRRDGLTTKASDGYMLALERVLYMVEKCKV